MNYIDHVAQPRRLCVSAQLGKTAAGVGKEKVPWWQSPGTASQRSHTHNTHNLSLLRVYFIYLLLLLLNGFIYISWFK